MKRRWIFPSWVLEFEDFWPALLVAIMSDTPSQAIQGLSLTLNAAKANEALEKGAGAADVIDHLQASTQSEEYLEFHRLGLTKEKRRKAFRNAGTVAHVAKEIIATADRKARSGPQLSEMGGIFRIVADRTPSATPAALKNLWQAHRQVAHIALAGQIVQKNSGLTHQFNRISSATARALATMRPPNSPGPYVKPESQLFVFFQ